MVAPRAAASATVAPFSRIAIPLAAPGDRLRVAVAGDIGRETATVSRAIAAAGHFDAILVPGDNFYPCGVRSADDPKWSVLGPLSALGIPIYAVLGNHDYCGTPEAQIGAPRPEWHLPARQYVLHTAVADFAMLDTSPWAWGESDAAATFVAGAFAGSSAPWRIAVGHHTIASSGWHGLFPRSEARRMRALRPELQESRVDLYICGHDHHEELLGGSPLLLVSGAGSDPVPMVTRRDETLWPPHPHLWEPIAFAAVEITPATLTVRFYDARGRAESDAFTFRK